MESTCWSMLSHLFWMRNVSTARDNVQTRRVRSNWATTGAGEGSRRLIIVQNVCEEQKSEKGREA